LKKLDDNERNSFHDEERTSEILSIPETASSTILETLDSTSLGEAPGYMVVIVITGADIRGINSYFNFIKLNIPIVTRAANITIINDGRFIDNSVIVIFKILIC